MYLVDYHTHTCCSPDSEARLSDMVRAAQQAGARELCTTDHCDLQQADGTPLGVWDWGPILKQFEEAAFFGHREDFRLLLGLELGGGYTDPARAEEILSGAPLDFVIGSVHNQSPELGGQDLFCLHYRDEGMCRQVLEDYMANLLRQAGQSCYDSLGHIIYPLRYTNGRAGFHMTLDPWKDQLDQVLRTVIHTGRAIEVNTHGGREVAEWLPILRRYRALGGELVTLGSDAHRPVHVARGLRQAAGLLQEAGFRYVTVYRRRRPEQRRL